MVIAKPISVSFKYKFYISICTSIYISTCICTFTADVELNTVIVAERYKRNGRVYIKVKDIKTKYILGKTKLHLANLFNGDNALGVRMNTFLNENWESLSEEVRPLMENAMAEIVRSSADRLFKTYSFDELMPE